ncbi:lipase family protein [Lonepinella sp. MS14437]|uniref:lipase family protein n=1 Tax=Lonepinella sp. MS14437 TaxID=3003620 RepID=UPI0036D922E8
MFVNEDDARLVMNSCRSVEHTLWLKHTDEYNYINAYNLAYLSQLAYSRVILENEQNRYRRVNGIVDFNFQEFINKAQEPFTVCTMRERWERVKMTRITDEDKTNTTTGLIPFITLVDIGAGIKYPDLAGYVDDKDASATALFYCDEKRAVIAIRGTYEGQDVAIDLDAKQVKPESNIKGELHSGFSQQATKIIEDPFFRDFIVKVANKELYVTGHSLGGAVATILSAYLYENGLKPLLYTYGSPRVGNLVFAKYYADKFTHFRHVNGGDVVPALPGRFLDGNWKTLLTKAYICSISILESSITRSTNTMSLCHSYNGLLNVEGDNYTHHGTLCQFIHDDNNVFILPFFQHEITQFGATLQTIDSFKEQKDRAHNLGNPTTHFMAAYLENVKKILTDLYQLHKENNCQDFSLKTCHTHPLHYFLQKRINEIDKQLAEVEPAPIVIGISSLLSESSTILKLKNMKAFYKKIQQKLETTNEDMINQYSLYSSPIADKYIKKQLDDLIVVSG